MTVDNWNPERPSVYEADDGTTIYRASAFGNCMGALIQDHMGVTPRQPPDWLQAAFERGTDAEPETLRWLGTQGFKLLDAWDLESQYAGHGVHNGQLETVISVGSSTKITCHPDGIADVFMADVNSVLPVGTRVVVEAKRLSSSWAYGVLGGKEPISGRQFTGNLNALPEYYKWQVSIEMASTGLPCVFAVAVSDMDTYEILEYGWFLIDRAPYKLNQIKLRALKLDALYERDEIPACEYAMYPCGWFDSHDTDSGVWAEDREVRIGARKASTAKKKSEDNTVRYIGEILEDFPTLNAELVERQVDELMQTWLDGNEMEKTTGPGMKKAALKGLSEVFDNLGIKGGTFKTRRFVVTDQVGESSRVSWKEAWLSLGKTEEDAQEFRGEAKETRWPKITEL